MEPSGTIFKKPVQLIFHYTGSNENADLKSIAWQDDKGQWHQLRKILTDTAQKTVSCFATHFSHWARFDKSFISPASAFLKVNKTINLRILEYGSSTEEDELATPGSPDKVISAPHESPSLMFTSEWTVNSIANGNSEVGVVSRKNSSVVVYQAPAVVPTGNPVAVSAQIYSNKKNKKLLLTSNITVVGDQYRFTYKHFDNSGVFHVIDSSSCIINMEKEKVRISDIINYKPWADGNPGGLCKGAKWTNPESFRGLIEITGMISSRITPRASEGGLPNVYVIFSPALGNTPSFSCKEGGGVPSMPLPALPKDVNFDIDGDDVIIHAFGKTGKNQITIERKNEKQVISIHKL